MPDQRQWKAKITPGRYGCSTCLEVFGGLEGFDAHRDGKGGCVPPDTLKRSKPLTKDRNGVWREPGKDAAAVARLSASDVPAAEEAS